MYDLVRRFPLSLRERLMISQKSQSYNLQFRKKEALLFLSLFSFFVILRQGLIIWYRLASNSTFLLSARITGMSHFLLVLSLCSLSTLGPYVKAPPTDEC